MAVMTATSVPPHSEDESLRAATPYQKDAVSQKESYSTRMYSAKPPESRLTHHGAANSFDRIEDRSRREGGASSLYARATERLIASIE